MTLGLQLFKTSPDCRCDNWLVVINVGDKQGRNRLRNRIEAMWFVIMTSLGSTAAPNFRNSQSRGRYCARMASFPGVVVGDKWWSGDFAICFPVIGLNCSLLHIQLLCDGFDSYTTTYNWGKILWGSFFWKVK